MFNLPVYVENIRREVRYLRIYSQQLVKSNKKQKGKNTLLQEEIKRLEKERRRLIKENERLKREIEKWSKTNNRYRIALFDHGNFKHKQEQEKKPKGGQKNHADTNKDISRNYASFPRQRIFAKQCGRCGDKLPRTKGCKEKTLIDIQINTAALTVILESERQWCRKCHKEIGVFHSQSLPFTEYGINTLMVIMYLRFKGKQSLRTISATLNNLFGLSITKSGIGTLLMQAKRYLRDKYEQLKTIIRNGEIMYNDETGWSVRGKSAWMWIMANEKETVYVAAEGRGKGIMEDMYGNSKSYSMHDGYAGYTNTVPYDKQLYCWAHILRFTYEETILSKKGSAACSLKEKLVNLYQTIRSNPQWTRKQKEQFLEKEFNEILAAPQDCQTIKNILHRLSAQKDGLVRSLVITKDGTNNLAERELRPLAISRNISFGSDTYQGMETTAILASVIQTVTRDKTQTFFPTLKSYLQENIRKKYPQYKHIPTFAG